MNSSETARDAQRVEINRAELTEQISRIVPEDGGKEVLPGFFLARASIRNERFRFPSSLQVSYSNESFAISKANTITGSTAPDAW